MMAVVRIAVPVLILPILLAGCAGPTRQVDFTLLKNGYQPVPNAVVRAVPIGVGTVPLPVSLETLEEFATAKGDTAITDDSGWATLTLYARRRHVIEVLPPIDQPREGPPAQWILEADGTTLVLHADAPGPWYDLRVGRIGISSQMNEPPQAASPPASSSPTSP